MLPNEETLRAEELFREEMLCLRPLLAFLEFDVAEAPPAGLSKKLKPWELFRGVLDTKVLRF